MALDLAAEEALLITARTCIENSCTGANAALLDILAKQAQVQDIIDAGTITAEGVGLGNVDNTADADKPVSTPQQIEIDRLNGYTDKADIIANGVPVVSLSAYVNSQDGGRFVRVASSIYPDTETDACGMFIRAGAVGTSAGWERVSSDEVSVIWYGADPTGVVDSTAAFNLATRSDYVSTGNFDLGFNKQVRVAGGQYRIDGTVYVHKGQHLYGDGEGATRIDLSNSTAYTDHIFKLGEGDHPTAPWDAGGLPPEISGMWLFGGPSGYAAVYSSAAGATMHNLFMTSVGIGIKIIGTDCRLANMQIDQCLTAMTLGGHSHNFLNILIYSPNFAIQTSVGAGGGLADCIFTGVQIYYPKYYGVVFNAGVSHRNLIFSGCHFIMNIQYATFDAFIGAACNSADNVVFADCQFTNMKGPAYKHLSGINNKFIFNDCIFDGYKSVDDYVVSTTAFAASVRNEDVEFNDCKFKNLLQAPIFLQGGTAISRVTIKGGSTHNCGGTELVTIGTVAPVAGSSVYVEGHEFTGQDKPITNLPVNAWHVGGDTGEVLTGLGSGVPIVKLPWGRRGLNLVDTNANPALITLPRADSSPRTKPRNGDQLVFVDYDGSWGTNNVHFVVGDNTVNGAAVNQVVNRANGRVTFTYNSANTNWVMQVDGGTGFVVSDEIVTAVKPITFGESGKTYYLDNASGLSWTLPTPVLGLRYRFIVYTAPTSGSYYVSTKDGDNVLTGTYQDAVGELVGFTGQDLIEFSNGLSLYGDSLEVESDGVGWHCKAVSRVNSGMTVSAT